MKRELLSFCPPVILQEFHVLISMLSASIFKTYYVLLSAFAVLVGWGSS